MGTRQSQNSKLLPYHDLDNLYLAVLRNALPVDITEEGEAEQFRWLIGCIILLLNPLSMEALAKFTLIDAKEISHVLYGLHSVVIVSDSVKEAPRLYPLLSAISWSTQVVAPTPCSRSSESHTRHVWLSAVWIFC